MSNSQRGKASKQIYSLWIGAESIKGDFIVADNEKSNMGKMQEKFADKEMSKEQLDGVAGAR